ncbi:hypothetical protein [Nonomuraea aridisoli]|uniref:Twin-arginine translocation signal domain-containing protein n=1 Tax=Nonomuraea aridisoli TaxID=2070368 RepID=A0A2W2ETJ4_9ACTN|nr:hypothetical protein [Nonomuraea aridisoli]PZG20089.1 hypothetical protein C1J01_10445 [Nonomuraea aridisoli]
MITRRRFIAVAAGTGALTLAPGMMPAAVATAGSSKAGSWEWEGDVSANGWPIDPDKISTRTVEGSRAVAALRAGDVAVVLLHVARRWHYEIAPVDTPEGGGITAYTTDRTVGADFESNRLSGTAIAVHPTAYPLRGSEPLWPYQELVVRDILVDCEGTVQWGGDLDPVKVSHFHIAVRPESKALARVARRLRTDHHRATRPLAGAVADPATPERLSKARRLEQQQTG